MTYPNSIANLKSDLAKAPDTAVTVLACALISGAIEFDGHRAEALGVNSKFPKIKRDKNNPTTFTHDRVLAASYADDENNPLQSGERWNEGRRSTNTGVKYSFSEAGKPVNPYINTGLNGRGVLGQFATNHAVDNGILVIKPHETGKQALYALGILRKFDNHAPAFSGGFAKYKRDEAGGYIFDQDAVINSQVEELFEEMISGSIALISPYSEQLEGLVQAEIAKRIEKGNGKPILDDQKKEIHEQIETQLKLQQVRDLDPGFIQRLRQVVASGRECFAGPVLNDNRNTNNAWIESRLSWFLLDDKTWNFIRGENPVFDYQFSAGDDASGVVLHRLDQNLIRDAFASHGAMFAFMAASFLLDSQRRGLEIHPDILNQMQGVANFLQQSTEPDRHFNCEM